MPLTVTAFYTFTPNTDAKSAEVNGNFSLIRGSNIPIDASQAAGADAAYDLGSSDYRWKDAYITNYFYLGAPNTSGGWRIGTGATNTELLFERYSSTSYVEVGSFLS